MKKIFFCVFFFLMTQYVTAQSDLSLRKIEAAFKFKYSNIENNAEIRYKEHHYEFGSDTLVKKIIIWTFSRSSISILNNFYIKNSKEEILIDNSVDSVYLLRENGKCIKNKLNSSYVLSINEFNPFYYPRKFFKYVNKSTIKKIRKTDQEKRIVLEYDARRKFGTVQYEMILNLTDTSIVGLEVSVKSDHEALNGRYYKIVYISERKSIPDLNFKLIKSEILFRRTQNKSIRKRRLSIGDTLNGFIYYTLNGDSVALKELDYDFYLIDLWYLACSPCAKAIPYMNEFNGRYNNLKVIGINPHDNNLDDLEEYKNKKSINYDILYAPDFKKFHILYPSFLILNSNLQIIQITEGITKSKLEELEKLLNHHLTLKSHPSRQE